ncbi:truncated 3-demethylubiquinone-9 3-methyltransferase [Beggiatoa sp. PS]|nr:truncated 3-demethylubiquinone-9 3-methyltransferase [Beggiatoa sp. PS]
MAKLGAKVTGIDMAEAPLSVAKLHLYESNLNIDYQQITAEQLSEEQPASFDIITCLEMLEHVPNPASVITACHRLVKPGGYLFFQPLIAILNPICLLSLVPNIFLNFCQKAHTITLNLFARQN